MKNIKRKLSILVIITFLIGSCSTGDSEEIIEETKIEIEAESEEETEEEWRCGTHNGKELWTGPRGGCYYYNVNNNKTYVDRSECNC